LPPFFLSPLHGAAAAAAAAAAAPAVSSAVKPPFKEGITGFMSIFR
jgi:hypothetical protein